MIRALFREAVAAARGQSVSSVITIVMVAGMCLTVLVTTGRTAAAEAAALEAVDDAGTRTIVVRASDRTGLTTDVLYRLEPVSGISSVTGFGPITDYRNVAIDGGPKVGGRAVYGQLDDVVTPVSGSDRVAMASPDAGRALGLVDKTGTVVDADGRQLTVVGDIRVPDHLRFLEPLLVQPSDAEVEAPLTMLVVLAEDPGQVDALTDVVSGLLGDIDRSDVTMETSAALADIRAAVAGTLGDHGHATVLGILAVSAALVGVNLLGLVIMRRKDFGRRRALGARRSLIVALLLLQVGVTSTVGAALGSCLTMLGLVVTSTPLPDTSFVVAVATLAVLTALIAALPPAVLAARRDPLRELRVP